MNWNATCRLNISCGRELPYEAVAEYRELLIAQIAAEFERSRDALEGVAGRRRIR